MLWYYDLLHRSIVVVNVTVCVGESADCVENVVQGAVLLRLFHPGVSLAPRMTTQLTPASTPGVAQAKAAGEKFSQEIHLYPYVHLKLFSLLCNVLFFFCCQ